MTIQVEEKEYCKVLVSYQAEPTKVSEKRAEVEKEFIKLAKTKPIKGFRAGKAPDHAVKYTFKKQIEERTKQEMLSQAYDDILFETKIKPIFYPEVSAVEANSDHFKCDMLFHKKPEFELKQYKDFEIPKPHSPMTIEQLVEQNLEMIRRDYGDTVPYKDGDFVELKDKITLSIKCTVNDQVVESLTTEGDTYTVGDNYFREFDDNILGMNLDEERTFFVLWDEKTGDKATFVVKVFMGLKQIPHPLDDTLAQKVNLKDLNELRSNLTGVLNNKLQEHLKQETKNQLVNRILANHDFEVPNFLTLAEAKSIAKQNNADFENLEDNSRKELMELAKKQVKLALILDSIKEVEPEANITSEEVLNFLKKQIQDKGQDPEKTLMELQKRGTLFGLVAGLQNQAIFDYLLSQSKIVE